MAISRRRAWVFAAFLVVIAGGALPTAAVAAPGDLDTSFGDGGLVRTPIHDSSHAYAIGRQSDDKLIVAGCRFDSSVPSQLVVARYTSSGALDTNFGENGVASVSFPGSTSGFCGHGGTGSEGGGPTTDLAMRPNDKIVLVGGANRGEGDPQSFAIAQLTPDGQLDGTFGDGGRVLLHPGSSADPAHAKAVVLEPSGRAIIAGAAQAELNDGDPELTSFAAVRIDTNGTPDVSFGTGGALVLELTENALVGSGQHSRVEDIVRYPDGGTALVGTAYDNWADGGDGQYRFRLAVVRLGSNGQLDSTFSGDGKLVTPVRGVNDHARAAAAALTTGGRLTVGLRYDEHLGADYYSAYPLVARFEEDGDPDLTFGSNGSTLLDFNQSGNPYIIALEYQADGKLVVAGTGDGNSYFAVARLDAAGALDFSFGSNGITLGPPFSSVDSWSGAWAQDLLLESSGNIVVAGFATSRYDDGPALHFALARYEGDTPPAPVPPPVDPGNPGPSPPQTPPAPPPQSLTLRAIGDSVTAAFGYYPDGSPVRGPIRTYRCRPPSPPKNRCSSPNRIAYPAIWARWHGLDVGSGVFRNDAVSGSTAAHWLGGPLKRKLAATIADNPDVILLTLGANPMLTNFAFGFFGPERRCMKFDLTGAKTLRCLKKHLKRLIPQLTPIYRRLTTAPDAHIGVLLYHAAEPLTIPKRKARLLLSALNAAIISAFIKARKSLPPDRGWRLRLISPGPFAKHGCRARNPLIRKPWVLSVDSCIHPNREGHRAFARAVEAKFGYLVP